MHNPPLNARRWISPSAVIAVAQLLGTSLWFSANSAAQDLAHDIAAGMEEIRAKREAYEAKRAEIIELEQRDLKPLAAALRTAREALGLHEIQMQMGLINRAIGGETGAAPGAETDVQAVTDADGGKLPPVTP